MCNRIACNSISRQNLWRHWTAAVKQCSFATVNWRVFGKFHACLKCRFWSGETLPRSKDTRAYKLFKQETAKSVGAYQLASHNNAMCDRTIAQFAILYALFRHSRQACTNWSQITDCGCSMLVTRRSHRLLLGLSRSSARAETITISNAQPIPVIGSKLLRKSVTT